jgi:hypothetical protein
MTYREGVHDTGVSLFASFAPLQQTLYALSKRMDKAYTTSYQLFS